MQIVLACVVLIINQAQQKKEKTMAVENVKAFYRRLEEDEEFRTEITHDETLKDLDMGKLITVATKHGYEFTEADFEKAKEELGETEISEAELEKVAGGMGFGFCAYVGIGYWQGRVKDMDINGGGVAKGFCLLIGFN
jgi:predicted ribosomally synthesized peptide with nif11-like leader